MKKVFFLVAAIISSIFSFSQKSKISWGEEFKLRRNSTNLEVIATDKSGVYLKEGHLALKGYYVLFATARESAMLIKLDKNLSEIYRNDFNRELKGKEFEQFFALQDKLYIIASEYRRADKSLYVFAAEINKSSGEFAHSWTEVTKFEKNEKKDKINFKVSANADSTRMIFVSTDEGKSKNEYQIQVFDKNLKQALPSVVLSNEFDPQTYKLEDVIYTSNNTIFLVGRVFEFQEGKKKKEKFLDFLKYNIRMYDDKGNQRKEFETEVQGKWLNSAKLMQEKDKDVVLAAFYSNQRKSKMIDGLLVQRINSVTGELISTNQRQIGNSMLSFNGEESDDDATEVEDDGESRNERKERERLDKMKDEGEGFSKYMKFRNIFYTTDDGLMVLAEKYHHYIAHSTSYTPGTNGRPGTTTNTTYSVYECGDMMMCKIDATGAIAWMQVLPKAQREITVTSYSSTSGSWSYFYDSGIMPRYAGFGAMQSKNAINIIFNDSPKNAGVLKAGQKAKTLRRFGKSDCNIVSIDQETGKLTRKIFFSNADVPTSMPRLGSVIGDQMYIVGKDDPVFSFGRAKIAVAKITIN
jgi:hypothetical protein